MTVKSSPTLEGLRATFDGLDFQGKVDLLKILTDHKGPITIEELRDKEDLIMEQLAAVMTQMRALRSSRPEVEIGPGSSST